MRNRPIKESEARLRVILEISKELQRQAKELLKNDRK
jgi:hypothetical protein